jgi:hypothetical protein
MTKCHGFLHARYESLGCGVFDVIALRPLLPDALFATCQIVLDMREGQPNLQAGPFALTVSGGQNFTVIPVARVFEVQLLVLVPATVQINGAD